MTTAAMPLEALEVVERASLTDEALCAASRYVETPSFSMGVGSSLLLLLLGSVGL